ncbi:MAG: diaminopimelate epimerase, partial [Candidatus Cloacimonadaceae bacterium]|nr:diaminopimelate epimerase [Candidatus Cloacimonadaceae bacterium]
VVLCPSEEADIGMLIFNSDGSRAEMCGSALRCVTHYNYELSGKKQISIETDSGVKHGTVVESEDKLLIEVNMGQAQILQPELEIDGIKGYLVDVGNLHFVSYTDDLSNNPHLRHGRDIEHNEQFERGVNVQFARKIDDSQVEMKIWEAAVGATLACGTGAVAVVSIGIAYLGLDDVVNVQLPGGMVQIKKTGSEFLLIGEVERVFSGEYTWKISASI